MKSDLKPSHENIIYGNSPTEGTFRVKSLEEGSSISWKKSRNKIKNEEK